MTAATPAPVKLSAQGLWKIYGPRPDRMLRLARDWPARDGGGDQAALRRRIEEEQHFPALMDVGFEVREGEIFVIMGLSGSGKSTLVRCLSRLIEPNAGSVLLDGEDLLAASPRRLVEIRRRCLGMVFQSFGLLPHLTVLDNVAFPLRMQGMAVAERLARAREVVALVGLQGRENSLPQELSGGQQQRVGIARSLAVGPELWFLDEPFSALDPLIRRQMQDEFLRLQRLLKKTIVFITHDIQEAFRLADRIAIMREGRIIQIATPAETVLNPADAYVADFTEDIALARAIRAEDLMRPLADGAAPSSGPAVPAATPMEALLPRAVTGTGDFVVTRDGAPVGTLSAAIIAQVLSRDLARRGGR